MPPPQTTMMMTNYEERNAKRNQFLYSLYNYAMGILWLGLGVVCLFSKKFGIDLNLDPVLLTIFGSASALYGLFRLWRGYRGKY